MPNQLGIGVQWRSVKSSLPSLSVEHVLHSTPHQLRDMFILDVGRADVLVPAASGWDMKAHDHAKPQSIKTEKNKLKCDLVPIRRKREI